MDTSLKIAIDATKAQQGGNQVKTILREIKSSANDTLNAVDSATNKLNGDLDKQASTWTRLRASIASAVRNYEDASAATFTYGKAAEQAARGAEQFKGSLSNIKGELFNLKTALLGLGIAEFAKSIYQADITMNQMITTLRFATGSITETNKDIQFLRQTTSLLGIEFSTAGNGFAQLASAAKGTKLEGQGVRDIFTAITTAGSALHLSTYQVNETILALTQMMSKGKVEAQELRLQLGNALPGAAQIAARSLGLTTAQLDKLIAKGGLLAADFLPRFSQELMKEFTNSGALEQSLDGPQAAINRLKNAWYNFKVELADNGFMEEAQHALWQLTKSLDPNMALQFGDALTSMIQVMGQLTSTTVGLIQWGLKHQDVVKQLAEAYISLKVVGMVNDLLKASIGIYNYVIAVKTQAAARTAAETAAESALTGATTANTVATEANAAALTEEAAAARAAAGASGVAEVALSALGGPLGILIGLLGGAAIAWATYGNNAVSASQRAAIATEESVQRQRKALAQHVKDLREMSQLGEEGKQQKDLHDRRVGVALGAFNQADKNYRDSQEALKKAESNKLWAPDDWVSATNSMIMARAKREEAYHQYIRDLNQIRTAEKAEHDYAQQQTDKLKKLMSPPTMKNLTADGYAANAAGNDEGAQLKVAIKNLQEQRQHLQVLKMHAATSAEKLQYQKQINAIDKQIADIKGHPSKAGSGIHRGPNQTALAREEEQLKEDKARILVLRSHTTNQAERLRLLQEANKIQAKIDDLEGRSKKGKSLDTKRSDFFAEVRAMKDQVTDPQRDSLRFAHLEKTGRDLGIDPEVIKNAEEEIRALQKVTDAKKKAEEQDKQWENTIKALRHSEDGTIAALNAQVATFNLTGVARQKAIKEIEMYAKVESRAKDMDAEHAKQLREQGVKAMQDYEAALDRLIAKQADWKNGIAQSMSTAQQNIQNVAQTASQAWTHAMDGMSNALTDMSMKGKADWNGLMRSIVQDLLSAEMKAASTHLFGMLASAMGVPGAGVAASAVSSYSFNTAPLNYSLSSGASAFANGGIMTDGGPVPLNKYANGGVANSTQLAMFGEGSTPEAFVPLPDGRTIPVNISSDNGSGGGSAQYHDNSVYNIDARGADAGVEQRIMMAMKRAKEETKFEIMDNIRRGGSFARQLGRA